MVREHHLAYWFDVATDLLKHPLAQFPAVELAAHLSHSFELTTLSWEWRETETDYGFEQLAGDSATFTPELLEEFHSEQVMARHPLLRWFAATGDPTPQSVERIPEALVPSRDRDWFRDNLEPYGCEHQMSIPYHLGGVSHGAFVLTRANDDFSDEELELARRLQRLIAGLYVQVRAQGLQGRAVRPCGPEQVLTGTEAAVLSLLAQGYTARGIARRLSNSPRTVDKHLEHIYRKLGVKDRLTAVRVAGLSGLTDLPPSPPADARRRGTLDPWRS
jgi:DNA-binding CsgD family transcriptional regulator